MFGIVITVDVLRRFASRFLNISKGIITTSSFTKDTVTELHVRSKKNISVSVDAVSMEM